MAQRPCRWWVWRGSHKGTQHFYGMTSRLIWLECRIHRVVKLETGVNTVAWGQIMEDFVIPDFLGKGLSVLVWLSLFCGLVFIYEANNPLANIVTDVCSQLIGNQGLFPSPHFEFLLFYYHLISSFGQIF